MKFYLLYLKRLSAVWKQLTQPNVYIYDASERIRAWFLTSVFMVMALALATLLPSLYIITHANQLPQRILIVWLASAVLMGAAQMVRRGYVRAASYLAVICGSVAVFVTTIYLGNVDALRTLDYNVVVILFVSLFLSLRATVVVAVIHIICLFLIPVFSPTIMWVDITEGPLRFIVLMTVVALVFAYYRVRLEHERREEVVESERRYRLVSDLVSNYAFSFRIEPDGRAVYEWMTDGFERITGYKWSELEHTGRDILYHPEDNPRRLADVERLYAGEKINSEYRIFTKSGEMRWLYVTVFPVRDEYHGWVNRFYGVNQDITDRKRSEIEKIQASVQRERFKLISDFVLAVSHDFRTALATITTSRYLLERQMNEPDRSRLQERLHVIQYATDHMAQQISNLEMISTLNNSKRVVYNIRKLLEDVLHEHSAAASSRQQTIVLEPVTDVMEVQIDPAELRRALGEIMQNAVNYTPLHGCITISLKKQAESAIISIHDTGGGIANDQLPHVFEFFYRADPARNLESGGVGLGLSIARLIVEAHSGKIDVESVDGQGSTFTVTLPLHSALEAAMTPA